MERQPKILPADVVQGAQICAEAIEVAYQAFVKAKEKAEKSFHEVEARARERQS